MIGGAWKACYVEDLAPGDRISLDEDALDALESGHPEDVSWDYVGAHAHTVERTERQNDGGYAWAIYVAGDAKPIRAVRWGRLVREVPAPTPAEQALSGQMPRAEFEHPQGAIEPAKRYPLTGGAA
jgi:hypothetical protein